MHYAHCGDYIRTWFFNCQINPGGLLLERVSVAERANNDIPSYELHSSSPRPKPPFPEVPSPQPPTRNSLARHAAEWRAVPLPLFSTMIGNGFVFTSPGSQPFLTCRLLARRPGSENLGDANLYHTASTAPHCLVSPFARCQSRQMHDGCLALPAVVMWFLSCRAGCRWGHRCCVP